jgi:hypothetical protein
VASPTFIFIKGHQSGAELRRATDFLIPFYYFIAKPNQSIGGKSIFSSLACQTAKLLWNISLY